MALQLVFPAVDPAQPEILGPGAAEEDVDDEVLVVDGSAVQGAKGGPQGAIGAAGRGSSS